MTVSKPGFLEDAAFLLYSFGGSAIASENEASRTVIACKIDMESTHRAHLPYHGFKFVPITFHRQHRSMIWTPTVSNEASPTRHKEKGILKGNRLRNTKRRELAKTVTDYGIHLQAAVYPAFGTGDLQG